MDKKAFKLNPRLIPIYLLLFVAAFLVIPSLQNPESFVTRSVHSWITLVSSAFKEDKTFLSKQDIEFQGLVSEARTTEGRFYIPPFDWTEAYVTEHAYPVIPDINPNSDVNRLYPYGPQVYPQVTESYPQYIERWIRMLATLFLWIGATAFIPKLKRSFRVLLGALIVGWGHALLSTLFKVPLTEIYPFSVPIMGLGALFLFYQYVMEKKLRIDNKKKVGWGLVLLLSPLVWQPFFLSDLYGPDARTMWFYRYKFEFLTGFIPELVLQNMRTFAQIDYPWTLGGAVGIASWLDDRSYAGWYENAAYGTLVWLVIALVSTWWMFVQRLPIFLKVMTVVFTFIAFPHYIVNGYMDIFWIAAFGLFAFDAMSDTRTRVFTSFQRWILIAFAISIKFEALFLFIIFGLVWLHKRRSVMELGFYATGSAALLTQKFYLSLYGVSDQYGIGKRMTEILPYEAIKRFEAVHRYIVKEVFLENLAYIFPLVLMLVYGLIKKKFSRALKSFGLVYLMLLPVLIVYTYTPNDLMWQLGTSSFRVFMVFPFFFTLILTKHYLEDDYLKKELV